MRPFEPARVLTGRRNVLKIAAIVLGVALVIFLVYKHYHDKTLQIKPVANGNDSIINSHSGTSSLDDKKILISAYEAKGDYASALKIAQQVAAQTKLNQDYMSVLLICGVYNVADKQTCINDTAKNLKSSVAQMPFASAYSAGAILEKNNLKKDSVVFYQRAYDTYEPDPNAENMLSKDQLKAHIDELNK